MEIWEMTRQEILEAAPVTNEYDVAGRQTVAFDAVRKFVRWFNEDCMEHSKMESLGVALNKRHECADCWQELCLHLTIRSER